MPRNPFYTTAEEEKSDAIARMGVATQSVSASLQASKIRARLLKRWLLKLSLLVGLLLCFIMDSSILIAASPLQWITEGGWLTLGLTLLFVAVFVLVSRDIKKLRGELRELQTR